MPYLHSAVCFQGAVFDWLREKCVGSLSCTVLLSWCLDAKNTFAFYFPCLPSTTRPLHPSRPRPSHSCRCVVAICEVSAPDGAALFVFCTPVTKRPFSFCRLTDFRPLSWPIGGSWGQIVILILIETKCTTVL
jgi:hypothetical protein